jgi:hypothetical protein
VIRSSLGATNCSETTGCPDGPNLKGVSGLVTRGGGTHGPVNGTVFNNNTIYLTGACSQGVVCSSSCITDIHLTTKNTISVAVWKGAFFSTMSTSSVDFDVFWATGTHGNQCQMSAGDCPGLTLLTHGTDPQFANPGNWDLHLKCSGPISPAIDAGTSLGYSADFDGIAIPQDGDYSGSAVADIGAYETVCP